MIKRTIAYFLIWIARLITGAQARWNGCLPEERQRLYFANHSSHLDFLLLWALLPPRLRWRTRPVAGADYWNASPFRRYLIQKVFRGVLIERNGGEGADPLAPVIAALEHGDSLIFFPEGTRNLDDEEMLPFKSGLYRIAQQMPELELVPARIENLNRVLPKGRHIPIPLICTITFGAVIHLGGDEEKGAFLARARQSVIDLVPKLS